MFKYCACWVNNRCLCLHPTPLIKMGSNVDNATSLALYVATLQTFTSHNASESISIGMNGSHPVIPVSSSATPSMDTVVLLSIVFIIICSVGIFGNILVITAVLIDDKMRKCVTNFFIINLAVADIFIMILGIPEIGQFVLSRGWLLGPVACKVNRFLLVSSLYCSVWSLLAVSVERYGSYYSRDCCVHFTFNLSCLCLWYLKKDISGIVFPLLFWWGWGCYCGRMMYPAIFNFLCILSGMMIYDSLIIRRSQIPFYVQDKKVPVRIYQMIKLVSWQVTYCVTNLIQNCNYDFF